MKRTGTPAAAWFAGQSFHQTREPADLRRGHVEGFGCSICTVARAAEQKAVQ